MTPNTLMADALIHGAIGLILALIDLFTSRLASPKRKRMARKAEALEAMETVLDAGDDPPASTDLSGPVAVVRDYLADEDRIPPDSSVFTRLGRGLRRLAVDERINHLSAGRKLMVAVGLEILYDLAVELPAEALAGVARTLYQAPALFVGLVIGAVLTRLLAGLMTSDEEAELDRTLAELIEGTDVAERAIRYEPPPAPEPVPEAPVGDEPLPPPEPPRDESADRRARFDDITRGR